MSSSMNILSKLFYDLMPRWIFLVMVGGLIFAISYRWNQKLVDWLRFQSLGTRDYVVEKLSSMYIDIPPNRILLGLFLLSFGSGLIVFLLILPQFYAATVFAIVVTIIGWKAPRPVVDWMYRKRVRKFSDQMVDALGLMSNGMKSGLSIVQALGLVIRELPNPVRQEFEMVMRQNQLGVSLEDAFNNLSKRIVSDDVEMFVTSINILKETGGNLAETFDTIVKTIRERIKVENKIAAVTAKGLMQGMIVLAVPPALCIFFAVSDPAFIAPLFTTNYGWAVVGIIILLELAGLFAIMKIIKIDI